MPGTVSARSQEMFTTRLAARYGCALRPWGDGTYCLTGNPLVADLAGGHMSLDDIAALLAPDPDFNPQAIYDEAEMTLEQAALLHAYGYEEFRSPTHGQICPSSVPASLRPVSRPNRVLSPALSAPQAATGELSAGPRLSNLSRLGFHHDRQPCASPTIVLSPDAGLGTGTAKDACGYSRGNRVQEHVFPDKGTKA